MPLKIRCPHCQKVLRAEDQTAGEQRACPVCGQVFTVPIPYHEQERPPIEVARVCPRCAHPVAPGTGFCPRCMTELASGQRLPLGRRLRLVPLRTWVTWTLGAAAVLITVFVAGNLLLHQSVRTTFSRMLPGPTPEPATSIATLAAQLLDAPDQASIQAAFDALAQRGDAIYPAVADELERSIAAGSPRPDSQRAAIDLLVRSGEPRWLPLLEQAYERPALHEAALHGRARLGDSRVLDVLHAGWTERLRRLLFFERLVSVTDRRADPAAEELGAQLRWQTARYADSLRRLATNPANGVVERLAGDYWDSWCWLGQRQAEAFGQALFEIAQPPVGHGLSFEDVKEEVRGARRALDRAAARAPGGTAAAIGLVLAQCAPQYRSARERIVANIARQLPNSTPEDQQRITWTLARLTQRAFGQTTEHAQPLDVAPADVLEALAWAGHGAKTPSKSADGSSFRTPPILVRRILTPERQLEHELLAAMRTGWRESLDAAARWTAAELGSTPRIRALLHPGRREFCYPAIMGAMVVCAESRAADLAPQLDLWRTAGDQPRWLRGLAFTTLAAIEALGAGRASNWPAGLEQELLDELDTNPPGWEPFRRVVAAGGKAMERRLSGPDGAKLPARLRARLLPAVQTPQPGRPGTERR
jgi:phage FluMu protein Com